MNKLNRIFTVSCFLFVIALAGYAYFLSNQIKLQELRIAELEAKYNESKTEIDRNNDRVTNQTQLLKKLDLNYSSRNRIDEEPIYNDYKSKIRSLIDKKINEIVPEQPLHGGKWFVSKISFISPSFALVEYEDGHDLFTLLIQIDKTKKGYLLREIN